MKLFETITQNGEEMQEAAAIYVAAATLCDNCGADFKKTFQYLWENTDIAEKVATKTLAVYAASEYFKAQSQQRNEKQEDTEVQF